MSTAITHATCSTTRLSVSPAAMEGALPGERGRVTVPTHAAGRDWLNDLPDEVLQRIMFFLNARPAVRTYVLSRRWRDLWRSVPGVNANFDELSTSLYADSIPDDELDHSVFTSRYLTRIAFNNVSMEQGFFKQLEMGCPALQVLFLHDCIIGEDEISSKSLKGSHHL
ncbi:hypothetical protein E2562_034318 [Oryza meyeriana var. granulata]|uniref:F-box domain-containing protein n=1 Tax=Oryza meyeriana var. granulata TaxID=110450 RepID=A0A6G1FF64_9ORYZ|nr:hypothetical protein E2562_034318 [Oryza meyeriana var. granulata]